ncbi:hypothetical protein AMTRI_Chr08g207490 [Amborella trichopoda]
MERHKHHSLLHFLDRSQHSAHVYLEALQAIEQKLRACHEWPDELPRMENPEFLNMMLLDGCFLLELHRTKEDCDTTGYADDDSVFGPARADFFADNMIHDLMLLENQIPLLVLRTLLGERVSRYADSGDRAGSLGMHPLHIYQMSVLWGDEAEVEKELKNPEPYHKKINFDGRVLKLPYAIITSSQCWYRSLEKLSVNSCTQVPHLCDNFFRDLCQNLIGIVITLIV